MTKEIYRRMLIQSKQDDDCELSFVMTNGQREIIAVTSYPVECPAKTGCNFSFIAAFVLASLSCDQATIKGGARSFAVSVARRVVGALSPPCSCARG